MKTVIENDFSIVVSSSETSLNLLTCLNCTVTYLMTVDKSLMCSYY